MRASRGWRVVMAGLLVLGCTGEPLREAILPAERPLLLELSRLDAGPGDSVAVALRSEVGERRLVVLEGRLQFDASALEYLGQDLAARGISVVNPDDAGRGELPLLSLEPQGLSPRAVVLAFRVRAAGYAKSLQFEPTLLVDRDRGTLPLPPRVEAQAALEPLTVPGTPVVARVDDLEARHYPALTVSGPARVPGAYVPNLRFGDVTLDGAINGLDVLHLAQLVVGNRELIAGSDAPARDAVVAGNVAPANLPGLGEAGDGLPPGLEAGGSRVVNGLDVLAVAREVVGLDAAVVGDPIPGRAPAGSAVVTISGDIASDALWLAGTLYRLQGTVRVLGGATLTVQPGTRVDATDLTSHLVITREGRLVADGTALEPIVFSCSHAAAPCWEGLTIQGHGPVTGGSLTSPPARGNGLSGCAEVAVAWGPFGGCDPLDDSGVLRYVRVEQSASGLRLQGVGGGTLIDYVQSTATADGVVLHGGSAGLRHLLASSATGVGLRWSLGWSGRLQFGILTGGLAGDAPAGSGGPLLYNLTLLAGSGPAVTLTGEPAGQLANSLTHGGSIALSLGNTSGVCAALAAGTLAYHHSVWAGSASGGDPDADPVPCAGYLTPGVETAWFAAGSGNAELPTTTGLLVAAEHPTLPDYRPVHGSPLTAVAGVAPPADGFFDAGAAFVGAVPAANATGGDIPWHTGWSAPAATGPVPPGTVVGTASSSILGALNGVAVSGGGTATATDATGAWTLSGVTSGATTLSVSNLPLGCSAPPGQTVYVPAGGTVSVDLSVTCSPPTGAFAVDVDVAGLTGSAALVYPSARGPLRRAYSLLGSDAVQVGISNVYASTVGAFVPGKVRVWFDLTLTGLLNGVALVAPTWPVPPPGQTGIFVFPYAATAFTTSGGVITLLPNTGQVVASVDWNGDASPDAPIPPSLPGAGGDPWSWFNDPDCGTPPAAGASDCYRYETFPPLGVLATSPPRRVGFDIDPSIGNFRAYLLVAADIFQP